ncbi:uncharacterized protein C8Q71DRAFT_726462 [Rhodofomes roseus]|uniref:Ribonuclease H1 N-terminal domain-containing protein n=1 Tax=Rhodofomes roseus TaxID=34475 RepID=A0ABQ8K5T1_9APHY|nr:uncharacterized protein C8Q71DRAFT_861237 [Rhodofomes roseus]XP_047775371.1 uncharacterized protein C8Q71DRAFT_726462 [Rhodofomes roseus]KAH9832349.1 hypothetical protein C8Q71DRAFT_861237 [Rhodofomes roseus]KAH9832352.1 hypothetical protein C8Q71DRAFT_726462 [Rhodofomes roseus]
MVDHKDSEQGAAPNPASLFTLEQVSVVMQTSVTHQGSANPTSNEPLAGESHAGLAEPAPAAVNDRRSRLRSSVVVVVPDDSDDDEAYEVEDRGVGTTPDDDEEYEVADRGVGTTRPSTPVEVSCEGVEAVAPVAPEERGPTLFDRLPQDVRDALAVYINPNPCVYYAVTRGRSIGIFNHWLAVSPLVVEVPGSKYKRCDTFELALDTFLDAVEARDLAIVPVP